MSMCSVSPITLFLCKYTRACINKHQERKESKSSQKRSLVRARVMAMNSVKPDNLLKPE